MTVLYETKRKKSFTWMLRVLLDSRDDCQVSSHNPKSRKYERKTNAHAFSINETTRLACRQQTTCKQIQPQVPRQATRNQFYTHTSLPCSIFIHHENLIHECSIGIKIKDNQNSFALRRCKIDFKLKTRCQPKNRQPRNYGGHTYDLSSSSTWHKL